MVLTRVLRRLLLAAAVTATGLAATPVRAQIESREGLALRDQIAELRHEVQLLQQQLGRGASGSALGAAATQAPPSSGNDLIAQLLVRVDQLDDESRRLRGRIDELQNQLQRQADDIGKRIDDLAFQVQNPKAAAAAAAAAAAEAKQAGAAPGAPPSALPLSTLPALPPRPPGAAPVAPRTPELALQEGNAALARRDYVTAETAAREVLSGNRTSPRAYDAMFLLAEAQSGERQYSQAALSYDDAYNRARKGAHAEDALLGLAGSLVGLADNASACQALAKLHTEFPTPRADLRDRIAAVRQRAGCR